MNIKEKFNEYIASGDPIISISDEQRDWILPFIERCVGEETARCLQEIDKEYYSEDIEGMDSPHYQAGMIDGILRAKGALTQEDKIK